MLLTYGPGRKTEDAAHGAVHVVDWNALQLHLRDGV